jgi:hypothetical protein
MRLGAAIVIVIGLCLAALILFERKIYPEIRHIDEVLADKGMPAPDTQTLIVLGRNREAMWNYRLVVWFMEIVGVALLGVLFVKVSMRKVRTDVPTPLSNNDIALIQRLAGRDQFHFQYGIITLLALMVAVALVCSAIVYPLR